MQCPRCQHENPPQAKFCLECGARFPVACARCGTRLPVGAKFCFECGKPTDGQGTEPARFASPQSYTPRHLTEKILTAKGALEGERKQVTVLFADLKGSMELLADRDPEEARKLLDPVLERMMEAVHRYEGTVNQVMGDGIMALFGAPLAHENHAVRACYAALWMQEAVAQYAEGVFRSHGVPLQIRVGLNSGEVVVRAIGSDLHMDYTAVGQTTHGLLQPLFLGYLGEAYVLAGRLEPALELAGRALTLAREGGQRPYEAWALRLLGEVSARRDPPEHADDHNRDALALAGELGMRPLVAHCHLGLGKPSRRTGKRQEAREHLTTATTMYREMNMRFWLERADAEIRESG